MITERKLTINVRTLAPLHIGGRGNPLTGMENAVARIGDRLVIPGPSLKGALRHQIERYLIDTYYDAKAKQWPQRYAALQPCMAGAGDVSPEEAQLIREQKYRGTMDERGHSRSGCVYPTRGGICPVCYLLGAQGLTGFVRLPFLVAEQMPDELYSGRISRAIGTIAQGTNRPYELVREGTVFQGTLAILMEDTVRHWTFGQPRNPAGAGTPDQWLTPEWTQDRILKELIVDRLKAIKTIGGYRSKGFGDIEVTVGS